MGATRPRFVDLAQPVVWCEFKYEYISHLIGKSSFLTHAPMECSNREHAIGILYHSCQTHARSYSVAAMEYDSMFG